MRTLDLLRRALLLSLLVAASYVQLAEAQALELVFGSMVRAAPGWSPYILTIDLNGCDVRDSVAVDDAIGPIYGLDGFETEGYGTVRDQDSGDWWLVHIPDLRQPGITRVGPIGFPDVQGLGLCGGTVLYGASFDSMERVTTLIEIDMATGVGTAIGPTSPDVQIVGLACDGSVLYGVSRGTLTARPKLYRLDPRTGAESFIAQLDVWKIEGLTSYYSGILFGSWEGLWGIGTEGGCWFMGGDYEWVDGDAVWGLGGWFAADPILERSWGAIKARYR
jgi:hypothetical protein